MSPPAALHPRAFLSLLLIACLFGANHVAARVAFNAGLDVASAVSVRSATTALVVAAIVWAQGVPCRLSAQHRRALPAIGALIGLQSLLLYSAVARLPVALALLAFNTFPIWATLWALVLYRRRPERRVLLTMPFILLGLTLALDAFGAASGLGAQAQWGRIGVGVGLAVSGAAAFGLALVLTQHEAADLDGRVRTAITMALVATCALGAVAWQGGFHWPQANAGWWGLAALTLLYGSGFTLMFVVLPRLGAVGNSPILNVEAVAVLGMAWLVLDQRVAPVQILGSLIVVAAVMSLGLRRTRYGPAVTSTPP
jgi:drug/metabolite transporter (DMT)-like permease